MELDTQLTTFNLEEDPIHIEFYLHSAKSTKFYTFEEYSQTFDDNSPSPSISKGNIICSFHTCGDFKFADLTLGASLNNA